MTDTEKLQQLRQDFGPGGEYEVCTDTECGHGECEAGRHVLEVAGEAPPTPDDSPRAMLDECTGMSDCPALVHARSCGSTRR